MNRDPQESQIFVAREESVLALSGNGNGTSSYSGDALDRPEMLWESRAFLMRCAAVGLLLSVVLALVIPSKYESTTKLMPPEQSSEGLSMLAALAGKGGDSSLGELAGNMLGVKTSGALFVGILHSRTVQDAIVKRFDLCKVYGISSFDGARKELDSRTVIWEDKKSGIIEAQVLDRSPQRAQGLARAYVEELDRAVNQLSTSAARREREFLESRLVGVKHDLDQASQDFSQFASRNTAIDIPAQGKAMVETAAVLQGQLMAAQAEEEGLKQIYTPNNVRVRSLEGRISELRHQLDLMGKSGTDNDSQSGAGSEVSAYPSIGKLPLLGVTYFDLYRRVKIQEALFEALTKKYEMAKVEEAKEIPTVRVLDPADLPERKATPHRMLIIAIGVAVSFVFGAAWILGLAKWERLDHEDARKLFVMRVASDLQHDWEKAVLSARSLTSRSKNGNHSE